MASLISTSSACSGLPSTGTSARSDRRRTASLAIVLAAALPGVASAQQAVSADPEFVNPNFGHRHVPGVAIPETDVRNTVRAGVFFQYERNPVTGYRLDEEVGSIVQNRLGAHLGVSWDFANWGNGHGAGASLGLVVPVAVNWGSDLPEFDASGVGLGDIGLGLQVVPYGSRHFNVGVRGALNFPSGTAHAYMGEESFRGTGAVQLMGKVGIGRSGETSVVDLDVTGDVAVVGRRTLVTGHDFDNSAELVLSEAARLRFTWLPIDLSLTQALVARGRFTNFFQGGAESGLEIYGGVQVPFRNVAFNTDIIFDAMAGRGATPGYGTTDLRVLAGLTFVRNPGRKPRPEIVVVEPPPVVVPPPVEEEEPPPDVEVFKKGDEIVIRKPVQFYVDTADIKPESLPLLQDVADIINADARIKHVVIEGHASEEGSFEYNYELSKRRAESIYKQLVLNGVAPERMSFRGMGETRPRVRGDTPEAYEANRRVEFKIVAEFPENTVDWPDYGESTLTPWSGEPVRVVTPPTPEEIETERLRQLYEKQRRDEFREETEEDLEIRGATPAPAEGATPAPAAPPQRVDEFQGTTFDVDEDEE